MVIWGLFNTDNNYNCTPDLECAWVKKPSFEELAKAMSMSFPCVSDELTLKIVHIWQGNAVILIKGSDTWELSEIEVIENE